MGGGGGSNTQTIQKADPWAGVVPYLLGDEGKNAVGLYPALSQWMQGANLDYFPGQTNAGMNKVQNDAVQTLLRQYSNPDVSGFNRAIGYATDVLDRGYDQTASGGFLNANPYIDAAYNAQAGAVSKQFKNATLPGLMSAYASGGRFGSGANANAIGAASDALGSTLNNLSADTYYKNYVNERAMMESARARQDQMQANAAAALPGLTTGAQGYVNQGWQNILGLGGMLQGQQQQQINADMARYNYMRDLPLSKLGAYSNLLQGFGGGTTTSNQSGPGGSFLSNALGGAMLGNSIYGLGANAGLWGGAAAGGLGALGSLGLGSGALMGASYGLAGTGALAGVSAGTNLFSTMAPLMALAL